MRKRIITLLISSILIGILMINASASSYEEGGVGSYKTRAYTSINTAGTSGSSTTYCAYTYAACKATATCYQYNSGTKQVESTSKTVTNNATAVASFTRTTANYSITEIDGSHVVTYGNQRWSTTTSYIR